MNLVQEMKQAIYAMPVESGYDREKDFAARLALSDLLEGMSNVREAGFWRWTVSQKIFPYMVTDTRRSNRDWWEADLGDAREMYRSHFGAVQRKAVGDRPETIYTQLMEVVCWNGPTTVGELMAYLAQFPSGTRVTTQMYSDGCDLLMPRVETRWYDGQNYFDSSPPLTQGRLVELEEMQVLFIPGN